MRCDQYEKSILVASSRLKLVLCSDETGEFVVNIVTCQMHQTMLVAAANFPEGFDKILLTGLTVEACDLVKPPRIAEAPVAFERREYFTVQAGIDREITIVEVVAMHMIDELWDAERDLIDWRGNLPIAHLWGTLYAPLGELLERPIILQASFALQICSRTLSYYR